MKKEKKKKTPPCAPSAFASFPKQPSGRESSTEQPAASSPGAAAHPLPAPGRDLAAPRRPGTAGGRRLTYPQTGR